MKKILITIAVIAGILSTSCTSDHFRSYDVLREHGTIEINDDLLHYYDSDGVLESKECDALSEMSQWYRVMYRIDELSFRMTPDNQ